MGAEWPQGCSTGCPGPSNGVNLVVTINGFQIEILLKNPKEV